MISLKFKISVQDEDIEALIKYQSQYTSLVHVFYRILCKENALKSEFYYLSKDSILLKNFDKLNNVELYKNSKWIVRCAIKEALSLVNKNKQICFGNKKSFNDHKKGKITKEELKERRLLQIYSIGTSKPYKGNRHFEILSDLKTIAFKPQEE